MVTLDFVWLWHGFQEFLRPLGVPLPDAMLLQRARVVAKEPADIAFEETSLLRSG